MAEKTLWNDGWEFSKLPLDTLEVREPEQKEWKAVMLPHDWLIYNTQKLYEDGIGWYRKTFELNLEEKQYLIRFDGVYMDCTVFVNDQVVGEWKYGYSTFEFDVTKYLRDGENEVKVRVVHRSPNSRWYSGAGIYRNVWWKERKATHIESDGIYITPIRHGENWEVQVDTEICTKAGQKLSLRQVIVSDEGQKAGKVINEVQMPEKMEGNTEAEVPAGMVRMKVEQSIKVRKPDLWDLGQGNLYRLTTELILDGQVIETESQRFGFRTIEMKPQEGLFLNGRKIKLHGVCEHHDLGCLGAAFSKTALRRKFEILQQMGVNSVRTSHNMPAPEVMDLADEMGILMNVESFDMWERPKTTYDYARFFDEWMQRDVANWVRRDRNHASLLFWSIGNEIYDTHVDERGQEVTKMLKDAVEKHDYKHHAPATIGSNYMRWENAQKCADIIKIAGYNYGESLYEEQHKEHPDWVIYGSETSSVLSSRNIYHFPLEQQILCDDDEQCSALGNSAAGWGAKMCEDNIIADRDAEYSMGQFIWSGFDYFGEPTPYQTRNCYFGQIDTAGFPKDAFYIYQAEWTDAKIHPMVHIFPYWDFNEGQIIDVRVCSNAPKVELYLNGKSQGTVTIDHKHGKDLVAHWKLAYEPGELYAVAYDERGKVIAEDRRHSFSDTTKIQLSANKVVVSADEDDLIFVELSAYDKDGYPVENARDRVQVEVTGAGRLIGIDNGDSTDYDQVKGTSKRLFGGKLLAVIAGRKSAFVGSGDPIQVKEIHVKVTAPDVEDAELTLYAKGVMVDSLSDTVKAAEVENQPQPVVAGGVDGCVLPKGLREIPVRKISLSADGSKGIVMDGNHKVLKVKAEVSPWNTSYPELEWKAITTTGIPSNLAQVEPVEDGAIVTALGDGSFILRCIAKNKGTVASVQSNLQITIQGVGQATINPYQPICAGAAISRGEGLSEGAEHGMRFTGDCRANLVFHALDFGNYGSDELTLEVFKCESVPVHFEVWLGVAGEEGSQLLSKEEFAQEADWMVFKNHTVHFSRRLKGVQTLTIVSEDNLQLRNLWFKQYDRAVEQLFATESDEIFGDDFVMEEDAVTGIGNNVSMIYKEMDFGTEGVTRILISGKSALANNSIHIRFENEEDTKIQLIEFAGSEDYTTREFTFEKVTGKQNVRFVFLPGTQFDFAWFKFER